MYSFSPKFVHCDFMFLYVFDLLFIQIKNKLARILNAKILNLEQNTCLLLTKLIRNGGLLSTHFSLLVCHRL
jgi:hypothetical protein